MRILLADDHTLLLQALRGILEPHHEVVGMASSAEQMLRMAEVARPEVVLLDISLPGASGLEAARSLAKGAAAPQVVFLTMHEDATMAIEAFRLGAAGYLLKNTSAPELLDALQRIARGERVLSSRIAGGDLKALHSEAAAPTDPLTPREREVVRLLARGLSMPQVAAALGISARTVAFHKYRAMESLQVSSNAELVAYALRSGLGQ